MTSRLSGRIALITGASSGIGYACAQKLAQQGCHLILWARRLHLLEELAEQLSHRHQVRIHVDSCDVRNEQDVHRAWSKVPEDYKNVDILVNNAGLARGVAPLLQTTKDDIEAMWQTNVAGVLAVTRCVVPFMLRHQTRVKPLENPLEQSAPQENGFMPTIIQIGSIAGHQSYAGGSIYCATKSALRSLTETLRIELCGRARVCSVDPGMVATTEFSLVRFDGNREQASKVYSGMAALTAEDVADTVVFVASRPPHFTVAESILLPVQQANATVFQRQQPQESQK